MTLARDAVWQCKGNYGMMEVIQVGKIKVLRKVFKMNYKQYDRYVFTQKISIDI